LSRSNPASQEKNHFPLQQLLYIGAALHASAIPRSTSMASGEGIILTTLFHALTVGTKVQERALIVVNDTAAKKRVETGLRQSNEIFRLLVESVKDYAIFLLDPDGKVATWNQGAERIKGYRADEIIGEHFSRFYPQEARESKWPDRELGIAAKEGRFVDEGLRVRKDGSTFWAYVVITALRDDDGELRGFSKVTRDLTERRALEERTRHLNTELRDRVTQLLESQRQVELRTVELQRLSGKLMRV
jgi:PAS domain S-box-containing protein